MKNLDILQTIWKKQDLKLFSNLHELCRELLDCGQVMGPGEHLLIKNVLTEILLSYFRPI